MPLQFGVFDHIEPIPGVALDQIYRERLEQIERLDDVGFYSYHLAEHHTPAVHSLAPSQNVFLAAAAERPRDGLGPCVYACRSHHPVRLIEEIACWTTCSAADGHWRRRGVHRGHFWGQDSDVEINLRLGPGTFEVVKEGLGNDSLTYQGEFYNFDDLPMRLRPKQDPHPPLWYMRNVETAAVNGMHTIIVGNLDSFQANVDRYFQLWDEHQGPSALTAQGDKPKIGLVNHLYLAETDAEAVAIAQPAWDQYKWNLAAPRRLEAERRGLTQFLQGEANPRPTNLPDREAQTGSSVAARTPGSRGFEEHAARRRRLQRRRRLTGHHPRLHGRIPGDRRQLLRGGFPVGPPVP